MLDKKHESLVSKAKKVIEAMQRKHKGSNINKKKSFKERTKAINIENLEKSRGKRSTIMGNQFINKLIGNKDKESITKLKTSRFLKITQGIYLLLITLDQLMHKAGSSPVDLTSGRMFDNQTIRIPQKFLNSPLKTPTFQLQSPKIRNRKSEYAEIIVADDPLEQILNNLGMPISITSLLASQTINFSPNLNSHSVVSPKPLKNMTIHKPVDLANKKRARHPARSKYQLARRNFMSV